MASLDDDVSSTALQNVLLGKESFCSL